MEPMRQCPQCGKYVAADRTYCLNCGVTLGVRCPECRAVSPVGAKVCTGCGHSFIKKKKGLDIPLWRHMKRHARLTLAGLIVVLFILTLVTAAFPAIALTATAEDSLIADYAISGYDLMGYFLSGDPASIEQLFALRPIEAVAPVLRLLLFGGGVGWLCLLCGTVLSGLLMLCNCKRVGRTTARRLLIPFGVASGGAVLLFAVSPVAGSILQDTLLATHPAIDAMDVSTMPPIPLILCISAVIFFGISVLLYAFELRRAESTEDELSLSRILTIPLLAIAGWIRRAWRRIRRMTKKGKVAVEREEPAFTVTPRFTTYLCLFITSLIFTQALLSKISHIFFWFMFLLPLVLLVYVLLSRFALSVDMISETVTTEKNTPYTYEFRIDNRSPLALPFIEAHVSIPQSNSVRCTERTVRLSMAPLTAYHMKNTVSFRFRGTYEIGVRCFYIYDFFRLFRVRVDIENIATVYVLPRRLTLDDTLAQAISDATVRTVRSPLVVDKLEVSDIRDYQNGDPLKSIHWKLSSKSETFVVKDYNTGTSAETVVFCDMAPHFPDEPPKAEIIPSDDTSASDRSRREKKKSRKTLEKEQKRREADARAKRKRVVEHDDTHAISEEELERRLTQRAAAAEILDAKNGVASAKIAVADTSSGNLNRVNVHELALPAYYDDMNEYLADGVVELTVAMVLAELRQGHEVLLVWFDRRSASGIFAYPLRGIDEFESIYHIFATAPLCESDRPDGTSSKDVTTLTAMTAHLQSVKQLFVISSLDATMLTALTSLPGVSDAGTAGAAEVVLYSPEERFKYPRERTSYLEGCRQQLSGHGISLTAGSFNIPRVNTVSEGGNTHEA